MVKECLFCGTATAMVTPFYDDGGVNLEALGKAIEYQISGGTDALVILGTTGEPATMTDDEKLEVMRYSAKCAAGRVKLIFGAGSNCTKSAIAAAKRAQECGADGVLCVTPYYNKCTQNGIYEYYKAICGAIDIPVIAYNVPSRTGVNILPQTAARIAEIDGLAGIKEACGSMAQICETMRLIRGKMALYSGDDPLNLPILAIGGAGVISVASNIAPKEVKAVYNAVKSGDYALANVLQDKLLPFISACFTEVNPIPVKYGCNLIGLEAGLPRAPLTELEPEHKKIMEENIKRLGIKL